MGMMKYFKILDDTMKEFDRGKTELKPHHNSDGDRRHHTPDQSHQLHCNNEFHRKPWKTGSWHNKNACHKQY